MTRTARRVGVALLGIAVLTTATACTMKSSDNATASNSTSAAVRSSSGTGAKNATIGFVAVNLNSPSIARIKDAFVAAAEKRGWKVEVFDGQGDQNATNNAASNFIQRGVSAIVNDSSPNEQMTAVMEQAKAKNIPFVSIYGGYVPQVDAEIGTNEFVNSTLITQEMVNRIGGQGRILKLNWTVLQALRDRDAGFHAVVGEAKDIKVVKEIEVKVPGQVDDAYQQVTNVLQSDKNIDAIWVGWDELAPPVVRAVEQAGLKGRTFVVGFDGNPFAWDLIRSGSPYVMEPANPFEPMGEKAVSTVASLLSGQKLDTRVIYMKPCLINARTVPAKGQMPDWQNCPYFPGQIGN
jgi:ABC-type sugar transport system substrate-binding protein